VLPVAGGDWTNVFLLDSGSSNAANHDVWDDQILYEIEDALPKARRMLIWRESEAWEADILRHDISIDNLP
jgi:hypothetical protein